MKKKKMMISAAFANCQSMNQLKQIHCQTIKAGLLLRNNIIALCCTMPTGDMSYACQVFDTIPEPSVFIWNTMIKGFSRIRGAYNGVLAYINMLRRNVKPDTYTFPFLFKGFSPNLALCIGKELHCHVVKFGLESSVSVQNGLIHMYSLCGLMGMARAIFYMTYQEDVFTWNLMLSGYNKMKQYDETIRLFGEMEKNAVKPSSVTLVLVLSACSKLKDLCIGQKVHDYVKNCGVEPSLILENALIDTYAACGEMDLALDIFQGMKTRDVISWTTIVTGCVNAWKIDLARNYFDQMPERDSVSWTAMIHGYIRMSCFKEALTLFREMQASNIEPNEFIMVSVLTACAHLGALEIGEWVRAYIEKKKVKNDVFVGNALIDMYFKCGSIERAWRTFNQMSHKDKFTWTAMVVGLAINGHAEEAIDMFLQMLEASIEPDEVTYVGVLSACTHAGLVDEGRKFFSTMISEHKIEPNVTHYGCMVDLLGRAGQLKEAHEIINNMTMQPNTIVWGTLLGACRVHKRPELAELAAQKILELDPDNGAVYVLLCNIYGACNKWENLHKIRKLMMDRGVKKIPGCSLIEMNGVVHEFVAGDQSHPDSEEIYTKLEEMARDLKLAGYSPDISEVFIDLEEEDKESRLYLHSEKIDDGQRSEKDSRLQFDRDEWRCS
ncbi:putative pentatricopeptide repeat-containing protein At3g15930 [Carica papaya]|uniref:putative pentatricopeptide repeat-containing protein At3g15930 n=1 Tax=Carica papaya TaxID=3649 RepID=UPI000B8CDFBA|nr:putative pentatricopeptide repeat-containing protein At3g15930 [Carica papaya]